MQEKKKRTRAPGAGRKLKRGVHAIPLNASVYPDQKKKFHRLGGSAWLQRMIDAAEDPLQSAVSRAVTSEHIEAT